MQFPTFRFRCSVCKEPSALKGLPPRLYEFMSTEAICDRCGRPSQAQLVTCHFMVLGTGPLFSTEHGYQHVACEPKRDVLSLDGLDMFSATGDPAEVTCEQCMQSQTWQDMVRARITECKTPEQLKRYFRIMPFVK